MCGGCLIQEGQTRTWRMDGCKKVGLVCLDVSRYRGRGAFPGGPKAHLEETVVRRCADAVARRVPRDDVNRLGEGVGRGETEMR